MTRQGTAVKVLGVIPARAGSERFPRKHHALVLGKPLITYTMEAMAGARTLDRVVVSTDDPEIEPLARSFGIEVIPRPAELATNTAALDDAVRHVCRTLQQRDRFEPDIVAVAQANVPIRKTGQVDEVVRRLEARPEATAVCTARATRLRPEWAKVMKDEKTGEVGPYLVGAHPFRKQDFPHLYVLDGSILAVRRAVLFATEGDRAAHAWLGKRLHILVQDHPMYSLEVDYPDEVALGEFYLRGLQGAKGGHIAEAGRGVK